MFGRLFGRKHNQNPVDPDAIAITAYLAGFVKLDAGLPARLGRYVFCGEDPAVLDAVRGRYEHEWPSLWYRPTKCGIPPAPLRPYMLAPALWEPERHKRVLDVLDTGYHKDAWRPSRGGPDPAPRWVRVYIAAISDFTDQWVGEGEHRPWPGPLTIDHLRDLYRLAEIDETAILDFAFRRRLIFSSPDVTLVPGMADFIAAHVGTAAVIFADLPAVDRVDAIAFLGRHHLVTGPLLEFVYRAAEASAMSVRVAAIAALRVADRDLVTGRAALAFAEGGKKDRAAAVATLAAVFGADAAPMLHARRAIETAPPVLAEIDAALQALAKGNSAPPPVQPEIGPHYRGIGGRIIAIPAEAPLPADLALTRAARAELSAHLAAVNRGIMAYNEKREPRWHSNLIPISALENWCAILDGQPPAGEREHLNAFGFNAPVKDVKRLDEIYRSADFTLWHLVRGCLAFGHGIGILSAVRPALGAALYARLPPLYDIRTVMRLAGGAQNRLAYNLIEQDRWNDFIDDLPPALLWPYFAENLAVLEQALGLAPNAHSEKLSAEKALRVLAILPAIPETLIGRLVDLGCTGAKPLRAPARQLLKDCAETDHLLLPLLQATKPETRAEAAQWLTQRGAKSALPALRAALDREKSELARAALLTALRGFGEDISRYVSGPAMAEEARNGLAKVKAEIPWLRLDVMPALTWRDGAAVDPVIPRWWVMLANKLKQPGGNALFDLYLDELAPSSADQFGRFLLLAFIEYDTRRPSDAEANAYAEAQVNARLAAYQSFYPDYTRERLFGEMRREKLSDYIGSANNNKGVLGLASRVPSVVLVQIIKAFLKDHHGRTAQCKALLECLIANPSPVALQYLRVVAGRHRTKTVQAHASQLIETLAERHGWTRDELGDRTIPDAGLDETGGFSLGIGSRTYTARLDPALKLVLFNPDGKRVQGLPANAEPADDLAAAKRQLAQARKEIGQVIEAQTARLYEAMCCGRRWPAGDWTRLILRHPIVGRLAQRLVWVGFDAGGRVIGCFRPLDDLSLTDAQDVVVDPVGIAEIGLAHHSALSSEAIAAWHAHLGDYRVEPLFRQIALDAVAPELTNFDDTAISDRKGWMIETFRLRNEAGKRGYTRGPSEGHGWFFTYVKWIDSAQLSAVIRFTGSRVPEENRPAALLEACFLPRGHSGTLRSDHPLRLGAVPPILWREVWHDLHGIAAAGTGYAADWGNRTRA